MSGLPKYHALICNTYTPTFTPGPPCTLQSGNVSRSRLQAGGTLFRSVNHAGVEDVNSITLELTVSLPTTVGTIDTHDCVLYVTTPWGNSTIPFQQAYDNDAVSPGCSINGPSVLRAALASNPYVNMPADDTDGSGWIAATDDVECLLTAFGPTPMSGASELPVASSALRTGPAYTLYLVGSEEIGSKGEMVETNSIAEWNGVNWVPHPSTLVEPVYDANGDAIVPHPTACP